MKGLHVADGLALPVDAVTQTFGILAKRGAGKSYTASVMAEEMLKAGQTVIAVDPTGAWWGLRSQYPVVIFGGEHADVPLEESAGEIVAQSIVENRFPAVLDLSLFRKGQLIRFMVTFAETLYRLNREAVHLFVDEADAVAPQQRYQGGDENRMLGAMEDIVRRGRKRGIGCTLITQRPAVLNKNVLTQCEVLVALRMVHPKDIAAVEEWVNVHGDPATARAMIDSLPSLPVGEAWFWCPAWDLFKRVKVRARETFDSGATPKAGEAPKRPKRLAEIDMRALGDQIKATVEKAKADDPRELRKKIADLERKLRERPAETVEIEKIIKVPVLENGHLERTEKVIARGEAVAEQIVGVVSELKRLVSPAFAPKVAPVAARPAPVRPAPMRRTARGAATATTVTARPDLSDDEPLSGPEQRILDALAWLESIGNPQPEQTAVAFLAGYTIGGGAFNNPKGRLRGRGLIEYRGDCLALTDAGRAVAATPASGLTTAELHRRVLERLPGPERKILQVLLDNYPEPLPYDELARRSGYAEGGGAFNNPRGRLRSLGLVDYPTPGQVVARPILFLD